MIIRAIKINEDGFCEKCPYQETQDTPSRSTCISCRMKEKDPRLILSELGVVCDVGGHDGLWCVNSGYLEYQLPEHLRVMIIEK